MCVAETRGWGFLSGLENCIRLMRMSREFQTLQCNMVATSRKDDLNLNKLK